MWKYFIIFVFLSVLTFFASLSDFNIASAQSYLGVDAHMKIAKKCQKGDGEKCEELVRYYDNIAKSGGLHDITVESGFKSKMLWAKKGCDAGQQYSCDALGWAYEHGEESLTRNYILAAEYYQKGCDNKSALSCNNLALAYANGRGVDKSEAKSKDLFNKACSLGFSNACKDPASVARRKREQEQKARNDQYAAMEFGPLQDACVKSNSQSACIEVYKRMRGEDPEAYVVAEHICWTFNRSQYCYEAGMDLMTGRGNTPTDQNRAFNNFYKGCYIRDKGQAESCYYGAVISFSEGGRKGSYDAMLMLETPCYAGYRDSCAFKKKAQRSGDAAVASANAKLRANHDDAMECRKTRVVGNGGRSYTSYDCRTNREWRLGKKP